MHKIWILTTSKFVRNKFDHVNLQIQKQIILIELNHLDCVVLDKNNLSMIYLRSKVQ